MSDVLDEKLDEILDYMGSSYYPSHEYPESYEPQNIELRKEAIPQIQQAFIYAGWHKECPPRVLDATLYPLIWAKGHGYMTGQEWFDRFMAEIGQPNYEDIAWSANKITHAARRAAGIK
jgi:hypothetical protein